MRIIKLFEEFEGDDIKMISTDTTVSVFYIEGGKRSVIDASELYNNHWEINRAFIQPELRGGGVGSKMLQKTLSEIVKKGADYITVTPGGYGSDPEDLYKFYSKSGFIMHPNQYGLMYYKELSIPNV